MIPDRSKMVPKPPTNSKPKESNLSSRNRQFSSSSRDIRNQREVSDLNSTGDSEQDSLIDIINSSKKKFSYQFTFFSLFNLKFKSSSS